MNEVEGEVGQEQVAQPKHGGDDEIPEAVAQTEDVVEATIWATEAIGDPFMESIQHKDV